MPKITLTWDCDTPVDSFEVIRSDTSLAAVADVDLPTPIATGITPIKTYDDTTVVTGNTYYYKVRAKRGSVSVVSGQLVALAGVLWTPENITTSMYFNADNVTIDGSNRVSQWTDLSGNDRHAVQSNNSRKPIANTFTGGQNALSFDGVDDLLWVGSTDYLDNVSGAWIFSVNNLASKSGYTAIVSSILSTGNGHIVNGFYNDKYRIGSRRLDSDSFVTLVDTTAISGASHITFSQVDFANADSFLYVDGTQNASSTSHGTSGNTSSTYTYNTVIGAYAGSESGSDYNSGINGKLGCVVIGAGVLSSSDREKLEGWAAHKYGLQSSLPSGHPYKNTPPLL